MIRVSYVLGSHSSRYSEVYKDEGATVESVVQHVLDTKMDKPYFDLQVAGGLVRITTAHVSAIEVRDYINDGPTKLEV
jgi:hypothetical protein